VPDRAVVENNSMLEDYGSGLGSSRPGWTPWLEQKSGGMMMEIGDNRQMTKEAVTR
jgi:hypothetical protein